MACFETKQEANATIQDLNETTRYIAKEYKRVKSLKSKEKIRVKETEQKSNPLNAVTTENIPKQLNELIDQKKLKSKTSANNNNKNWQTRKNRQQRTRNSDHQSVMLWMWFKST